VRLLRSWPKTIPPGRSYVEDGIDRVVINNCDYGPLRAFAGDDLLLLEWDIAASQEDLIRFAAVAHDEPDRVLVAPYRIYADVYRLPRDVWAHRHWDGEPRGMSAPGNPTFIDTGAPTCNLFGLGMVYLPAAVLAGWFAAGWAAHFGDVEFSMWHYLHVAEDVPICWDVRPVHLNYLTTTVETEIAR
jgi:hypothetical protein